MPKEKIGVTDNLAANQYLRENWQRRITNGDSVMRQLSEAHGKYREFHTSLEEAYAQRDPETTEDGHFMAMRRLGWKSVESAAKANDKAIERARAEVEAIKAAIKSQLGLVENHRAAETREFLRSLSTQERDSILNDAIKGGDAATIAAVTEAPSYLSGVSRERAGTLKRMYETTHGGDLPARMADIQKAIDINTKTGDDALEFYEKRLPSARAKQIEASQAAARAMRDRLEN